MTERFVGAVDWGTSSFRLWVLDRDGNVLAADAHNHGMASLNRDQYARLLETSLAKLEVGPSTPVLICGMAGAAQGWHEARYIDVPAPLARIANSAVKVPAIERDVRILPGLAQRRKGAWDVMRGEETILLGATDLRDTAGTACLPGTHSKWVRVESGTVTGFATAMTGEMFGLLSEQSTLSHFMRDPESEHSAASAFDDGVREALEHPEKILSLLFGIRAMPLLLGDNLGANMRARLSGLLIGLEISGFKEETDATVTLLSEGVLAKNYAAAFKVAGVRHVILDSSNMARAGLFEAAKALWPNWAERTDQ